MRPGSAGRLGLEGLIAVGTAVPRHYAKLNLGGLPQLTRVTMMESSDSRNSDDLPHFWQFDRPLFGSVLLKSKMRSILMVLVDVGLDHAPKLSFIDRDHMVQAISS